MRLFSAIAAARNSAAANGCRKIPHAGQEPQQRGGLLLDDRGEVDRAVDEDQPQHGEPHDQLVGDHLRAGAHRAQHRELVRRRPAGEHRADDRHPAEREHDQQPRVEPGDLHRIGSVAEPRGHGGKRREELPRIQHAAERDDGEHQQHGREHHPRRDGVREPVVGVGLPVLLQQHLEAVGDAVEQPQPDHLVLRERDADVGAVGADPVGHDRGLLALDPRQDRAERHQHRERVADVDGVDDEVLGHGRLPGAAASAANTASASTTPGSFAKQGSKALTVPWKFV